MLSIEEDLKALAQEFYISVKSAEKPRIEVSIDNIASNLKREFGRKILAVEIFGSYRRKTILPRKYDPQSDIDLLVVFDHENINANPSTYRKHLHDFATRYYPKFLSYKSLPSVVLELNHINYDLVPAYTREEGFFNITDEVYIPESATEWKHTDIDGFGKHLEDVNREFNYNVKRIIRLLKAWNAKAGYPIASFELEQLIADMNFSGDNIEDGFFYAIDELPDDWSSDWTENKVQTLKENAESLKEALEDEEERDVSKYLKRIFPIS